MGFLTQNYLFKSCHPDHFSFCASRGGLFLMHQKDLPLFSIYITASGPCFLKLIQHSFRFSDGTFDDLLNTGDVFNAAHVLTGK